MIFFKKKRSYEIIPTLEYRSGGTYVPIFKIEMTDKYGKRVLGCSRNLEEAKRFLVHLTQEIK